MLIILKFNILPGNILFHILLLLHLKHLLIKHLLQLFISVVDTQLLKRICLKNFKTKYVKQANKWQFLGFCCARTAIDRHIHFLNDPVEHTSV